jgi:hypothetical protein
VGAEVVNVKHRARQNKNHDEEEDEQVVKRVKAIIGVSSELTGTTEHFDYRAHCGAPFTKTPLI